MARTQQEDDWPSYLPGPRNDILALGVISLTYGLLETMFKLLFASVGDMNEHQVAAIFERLPNNHRLDQANAQQNNPAGKIEGPRAIFLPMLQHLCRKQTW